MKNVEDLLVNGVYLIPEKYLTKGILKNIQQVIDNKERERVNKAIKTANSPYSKVQKDFKDKDSTALDDVYIRMLNYHSNVYNLFYREFATNILNKGVITKKQAGLLTKLYLKSKESMKPTSDQVYEMDGMYD